MTNQIILTHNKYLVLVINLYLRVKIYYVPLINPCWYLLGMLKWDCVELCVMFGCEYRQIYHKAVPKSCFQMLSWHHLVYFEFARRELKHSVLLVIILQI